MDNFRRMLKGAGIVLILCLAIYGAFVLCKRPPNLTVSEEDRVSFQKEHGLDILSNETTGGRSAVFNTVSGVPRIGASRDSIAEKKSLPAVFGESPPYPPKEAPTFAPTFEPTEAPPFGAPPAMEAPPFTPVVSSVYQPPAAAIVQPSPQHGAQYPVIVPSPLSTDQPQTTLPPIPTPSPAPAPGPFAPPFSYTHPVDSAPSVTAMLGDDVDNAAWDGPVVGISESVLTNVVTFVPPTIKPLPKVEEEAPIEVVVATLIPSQSEPILQPIPAITIFPDEYRQASIRRISTAPPPDAVPVVSFLPVNPTTKDSIPDSPPNEEPATSIVSQEVPSAVPGPTVEPVSATVPHFVEPKLTTSESPPFTGESLIVLENKPIVSLPKPPIKIKAEVREQVVQMVEAQREQIETNDPGKIRNAYIRLSKLYEQPELNEFERAYLTPILDHLAVGVIFSRRIHILEAPYVAKIGETAYTLRGGETLMIPYGNSIDSIATAFNLTPTLLMKINGLTNKRPLEPGTELKVIQGQFDGRISMEHREFTLILGGLYAGRFPIAVGEDIQHVHGDFTVTMKGDTPQGRVLTLSNGIALRGIDRPDPGDSLRSIVRLAERDAAELYDILAERSIVAIGK